MPKGDLTSYPSGLSWNGPRRKPATSRVVPGSNVRISVRQFRTNQRWWDNPTMILTLDAKRRLTVPANLAPAEPGDHFILN